MNERTEQQRALAEVQRKFGDSAFTQNYIGFREVGFRQGALTIRAIGQTWDEAITKLELKVK